MQETKAYRGQLKIAVKPYETESAKIRQRLVRIGKIFRRSYAIPLETIAKDPQHIARALALSHKELLSKFITSGSLGDRIAFISSGNSK
jgi:hypothetical protein